MIGPVIHHISSRQEGPILCVLPDVELLINDAPAYCRSIGIYQGVDTGSKIAVVSGVIPKDKVELEKFVDYVCHDLCVVQGVKSVNLLAVARGAQGAIAMALRIPRTIRRLVLLDPEAPEPLSKGMPFLLAVDRVLPKQFSMRCLDNKVDLRSSLHRVRCPTVVFWSQKGMKSKKEIFSKHLWEAKFPNVWSRELSLGSNAHVQGSSLNASEEILQFLQVPLKMSQKRSMNE